MSVPEFLQGPGWHLSQEHPGNTPPSEELSHRMFGGRHGKRRVSHGSKRRHGQPDLRHAQRPDSGAGPEV